MGDLPNLRAPRDLLHDLIDQDARWRNRVSLERLDPALRRRLEGDQPIEPSSGQPHRVVVAVRAPDPVPSLRYRLARLGIPAVALGVAAALAILVGAVVGSDHAAPATPTTDGAAPSSTATQPLTEAEQWYRDHLLLLGDLEATASTAADAAVVDNVRGTVAGCRKLTVLARQAAAIPPLPDPNFTPEWDQALQEFRDGAALCEGGLLTSDATKFRGGALTLVAALARLDRISTAFG